MSAHEFQPAPFEPGARITWSHYYPDATRVVREGIVWERAPVVDGGVMVAWVVPDERLSGDLYTVIAVAKSTRRSLPVHGDRWPEAYQPYVGKGALYSSNYAGSPTGQLAAFAARRAHDVHRARELAGGAG